MMSNTPKHNAELNQLYVLQLWRATADTPRQAVLRFAAGGERIGFAGAERVQHK